MYDITDKMNPIQIGLQETTTSYTHNSWVSDDGKYLFTTDEKENAFVDAYDITNPNNIKLLDQYQPLATENNDVIPHNTHYLDGYLVTSWNTDGVVIIDTKRPHNLVKVGSYDTYLEPTGGFAGCWGAFPFLESGFVLASDRQTGLYILETNYTRACWLEGSITECESGLPINGVNVAIMSSDLNREKSDPLGFYATGQVTGGTFNVEFSHPEYDTIVMSAVLVNDELTILDIEMCREDLTSIPSIEIGNLGLSPNPASDFIQLDLEEGLNYNYIITDVQGKIFQQSSLKDNRIDVSAFANGIYFIKLMQGGEIVGVNKFVVQR